jgi:type IV pilus assembly protein PilE
MRTKLAKGFTLIELMIVVAIIAILASVAYYNYSKYAFRAHRVDGKEFLERVASAQERYYTNFNKYSPDLTTLNFTNNLSTKGYYSVATANGATGDNQSFLLTATALSPQDKDACGNLTLSNANAQGFTGSQTNGNCW